MASLLIASVSEIMRRAFYLIVSVDHAITRMKPSPEVIKLFSCSTQLSTKFQPLIKTKMPTKKFLALYLSDVVIIMLINDKMPTIVGILTFKSRINFKLS